jgi:DNA-binding beta-propeller fold protein YncE
MLLTKPSRASFRLKYDTCLLVIYSCLIKPTLNFMKFLIKSPVAFLAMLGVLLFNACKPDVIDPVVPVVVAPTYEKGVLITNEGPFKTGTGTIDFWDREKAVVTNDVFGTNNSGAQLGNIVQSVNVIGGKAYVVVNNSGKVEITDVKTFKSVGKLEGFDQPRYILDVDGKKAYLTQWGKDGLAGSIKVIDLATNTISKTIETCPGPEKMLKVGTKIYVTCSGGPINDSRIMIIDIATDKLDKFLDMKDDNFNPNSLQVDATGAVWVLCRGKLDANYKPITPAKIVRIVNGEVNATVTTTNGAANLCINKAGTKLFYTTGTDVMTWDVNNQQVAVSSFAKISAYNIGIDPKTNFLYIADPKDYISKGEVLIYNPNGVLDKKFTAGVIPSGFWFSE